MTSVDSNFNFLCGRPHGAGPPPHVHMRLPEPDPPLCGRHKWMAPYAYFLHEIIFNIFCQEIFQWLFVFSLN